MSRVTWHSPVSRRPSSLESGLSGTAAPTDPVRHKKKSGPVLAARSTRYLQPGASYFPSTRNRTIGGAGDERPKYCTACFSECSDRGCCAAHRLFLCADFAKSGEKDCPKTSSRRYEAFEDMSSGASSLVLLSPTLSSPTSARYGRASHWP